MAFLIDAGSQWRHEHGSSGLHWRPPARLSKNASGKRAKAALGVDFAGMGAASALTTG